MHGSLASSRHRPRSAARRATRQQSHALLLRRRRSTTLPERIARSESAPSLLDPCLRAHEQSCPPAGVPRYTRRHRRHDAIPWSAVRPRFQYATPTQRYAMGGAIQVLPGRLGRLSASLLPLHRTQSRARRYGRRSAGPPLVKLSRQCARRD